jgi:poly(A) polymerase
MSPTRRLEAVDFLAAVRGDPILAELAARAAEWEVDIHLVGGAVRNRLLGRRARDDDFVLLAPGEAGDAFLEGLAAHRGAKLLRFEKKAVRERRLALPARHLDFVLAGPGTLSAELSRRDFTFNALAVSLADGRIRDPFDGARDLAAGIVRQVSPGCFIHDPLRALRAVRFLADGTANRLDGSTREALQRAGGGLASCASERIRDELDLLAGTERFGVSLETLRRLGLLEAVAPEATNLAGVSQNRYHHLDCWQHTVAAVELADRPAGLAVPLRGDGLPEVPPPRDEDLLVLKYAVLFHDLGKPETRTVDEAGEVHFYQHEKVSVQKGGSLAKRWRFPHRRLHRVALLVRHHLRPGALGAGAGEKALRRLIHSAGTDLDLLLLLSLADLGATCGDDYQRRRRDLVTVCRRLRKISIAVGEELVQPRPLLGGHEIMELLGLPPGPEVGAILDELLLLQVEGVVTGREEAVAAVRQIRRRRETPPEAD